MIAAAAAGSLIPGQLDRDLVVALRPDLGLGDAEPVDAVAHDLDGAVEVLLGQLPVARRNRLQRHLEPALQVEAERRPLLERRAGDGEQRDPDEGRGHQGDDENGCAAGHLRPLRLAAVERFRVLRRLFAHDFLGVVNRFYAVRRVLVVSSPRRLLALVLGLDDASDRPARDPDVDPVGDLDDQVVLVVDLLDDPVEAPDGEDLVARMPRSRAVADASAAAAAGVGSRAPTAGRTSRRARSGLPSFLLGAGGEGGERVRAIRVERAAGDRIPRAGGQSQGEPQIMQREEPRAEELLLVHEMPDERAREPVARGAGAAFLERPRVAGEARVAQVEPARAR